MQPRITTICGGSTSRRGTGVAASLRLQRAAFSSLAPTTTTTTTTTSSSSSTSSFLMSGGCYGAPFRASRVLLRSDRKGPVTRMDIANTLGADTIARVGASPLELNLFEDPAGGLAAGPAEELSAAEVDAQVRLLAGAHDRNIFYFLYTPFVDVVALVVEAGLLPQNAERRSEAGGAALPRPEEVMARWFTDGTAVLKDPHGTTAGVMGERRWTLLGEALCAHCAPIEEVMPLTRVVRREGLPEEVYVPFLRQLAMSLAEPEGRRAVLAVLPGLILGLANGRAPPSLQLPDAHEPRVLLVAELFLAVAQECGNTDLAYLGIQLLRANDIAPPFPFQKQLTNVFSTAARLQTDWMTRATGQLVDIYPKWLEYLRRVRLDNIAALARLQQQQEEQQEGDAGSSGGLSKRLSPSASSPLAPGAVSEEGEDVEEGQHEYFSSRRAADIGHMAAMERNVDAALASRAPALEAEVARRQQQQQQRQELSAAAAERAAARRAAARVAAEEPAAADKSSATEGAVSKKGSAAGARRRASTPAANKKTTKAAKPKRKKSTRRAADASIEVFDV